MDIKQLIEQGRHSEASSAIEAHEEMTIDLLLLRILNENEQLNLDVALELIAEASKIPTSNDIVPMQLLAHKIFVYVWKTEFPKALELISEFEFETKFVKPDEHNQLASALAAVSGLKGRVYGYFNFEGKAKEGITILQDTIVLCEAIDDRYLLATSHTTLSSIYFFSEEYEAANNHLLMSLKLFKLIGNKLHIARVLNNLGNLMTGLGNFEAAKNYLDDAHQTVHSIEEDFFFKWGLNSEIVLSTIFLQLTLDDYDAAKEIFGSIQLENLDMQNPLSSIRYKLSKALILKYNPRLYYKMQSYPIFIDIVENYYETDVEYVIQATIELCDLLIDELSLYGNPEVLTELNDLINTLHRQAESRSSVQIIIQALIMKSKIALITTSVDKAIGYLEYGRDLAIKNNLDPMIVVVEKELENLNKQYEKWSDIINSNASLTEKLQRSDFQRYIQDALRVKKQTA
ncbi:MAG: tetratricopeptide repeat protein [Candidatus Heimdallarchaeota archaeon]|nr:tetratricopeptide repeat protein [Candidatus Heimdallarchaeota archaeon]